MSLILDCKAGIVRPLNIGTSKLKICGSEYKISGRGSEYGIIQVSTEKTCNSGTATETLTNIIPAKAIVRGVTARVITVLAGAGLTTWKLGHTASVADDDNWGAALAVAAGTTVGSADFTATPSPPWQSTAYSITIKATAGQFDSGLVVVELYYEFFTGPTR